MNARVLMIAVAAGVVAALTVAGVMILLVFALFVSPRFLASHDVMLPESELASGPEAVGDMTVSVYLTRSGTVLIADHESSVDDAPALVLQQLQQLDEEQSAADVTVIIRADADGATGTVQELIKAFQASGFERFKLRAAEGD